MTPAQGNILVIRGGAIGDFILTLPVLQALRSHFPSSQVEVLGYPHIAQLALHGGLVDAVRPIEAQALARFFAAGADLPAEVASFFARFHLIISYLYDPDGIFASNIQRCSKAQFIAGPHRPTESAVLHATNVFLKPLEALAIFEPSSEPRLNLPSARKGKAAKPGKMPLDQDLPLIAVHPGSGSEKKNWPERKWAELLSQLVRRNRFNLLLVGGEAEEGKVARLAAGLPSTCVEVVQNIPLPQLAERLAGCDIFVGHDSGISHLAAAVGLKGVLLWGGTSQAIWRPMSNKIDLLCSPGGIGNIAVEEVLKTVEALVRFQQTG